MRYDIVGTPERRKENETAQTARENHPRAHRIGHDGHCIRTGTDDGCIYPSLAIASSLLGTFALLVFITGDAKNGGMVLLLACLVSPYGLPKAAEWLWCGLDNLRGRLWRFVFC